MRMKWCLAEVLCVLSVVVSSVLTHGMDKRIIGGDYAAPEKYPWAVSIRGDVHAEESSSVCGATLISQTWLLTAAHCFYTRNEEATRDMREPSLWHISAGQVFVKLTYENENRPPILPPNPEGTQTRPEIPTRPPVQAPTPSPPPPGSGEGEQPTKFNVCEKLQVKVMALAKKAQKCWTKLLKALAGEKSSQAQVDAKKAKCAELHNSMVEWSKKLDKCYEEVGNTLDVSEEEANDNVDVTSKREISSNDEEPIYSHYHVDQIILHPQYVPDRIEYDIALMRLDNPLPFNQLKGVAAINLPEINQDPAQFPALGTTCVIVGWGCTEAGGGANPKAKFAELEVISNARCNEVYENMADLNSEHEFCAGFVNKKIGVCPGDSGSGLVCRTGAGNWTVAGVTSATHVENPGNYPGLFSRVSFFNGWIRSTIAGGS